MKESDILFKPLNSGVGFSSSHLDSGFSYYKEREENPSLGVFDKLSDSSDFYDDLVQSLEEPLLESLKEEQSFTPNFTPSKSQEIEKQKPVPTFETYSELHSPLNLFFLPPLGALRVDITFTLGLFMLLGVLGGVLFETYYTPPVFLTLFSYGVFYQIYTTCMRLYMGSTFGEDKYNIGWSFQSPTRFIVRGLLVTLTGFILLPLCSWIFRRDLLKEYTGLYLRYNI